MNGPTIICGCHGGGTSFITKTLIMNGLYCGHAVDRNPISFRKTHENKSFQNFMEATYREINKNHKFADPNSNIDRNIDVVRTTLSKDWAACEDVDIDETIKKYLFTDKMDNLNSCWGWKNPRNAVFIPLWTKIFPNAKYLFVQKKRCDFEKRTTSEGRGHAKDFTDEFVKIHSEPKIYSEYLKDNYMVINFEKYCEDVSHFNEVQKFTGLQQLSESLFNKLLKTAGLEK